MMHWIPMYVNGEPVIERRWTGAQKYLSLAQAALSLVRRDAGTSEWAVDGPVAQQRH